MNEVEREKLLGDITRECLAVRIRILDRVISSIYNNAISSHGLKITQMSIIVTVAAFGPIEVKALCNVLNMGSSTLSRALARIEKKGYLRSEPSGQGRNLVISVTDRGLKKIELISPDWQKAEEEAAGLLGLETVSCIRHAGDILLKAGMAKQAL